MRRIEKQGVLDSYAVASRTSADPQTKERPKRRGISKKE
jgi:hypothetical protein